MSNTKVGYVQELDQSTGEIYKDHEEILSLPETLSLPDLALHSSSTEQIGTEQPSISRNISDPGPARSLSTGRPSLPIRSYSTRSVDTGSGRTTPSLPIRSYSPNSVDEFGAAALVDTGWATPSLPIRRLYSTHSVDEFGAAAPVDTGSGRTTPLLPLRRSWSPHSVDEFGAAAPLDTGRARPSLPIRSYSRSYSRQDSIDSLEETQCTPAAAPVDLLTTDTDWTPCEDDAFLSLPDTREIYVHSFQTKVLRQEIDRWPSQSQHSSEKGCVEVFRSLVHAIVHCKGSALLVHAPAPSIQMLRSECQFCDGGYFQKRMQTHGVANVDHADFLQYVLEFTEPTPGSRWPDDHPDPKARGQSKFGGFCISSSGAICLAGVKFLSAQRQDVSWQGATRGQVAALSVAKALDCGVVVFRTADGSLNIITALSAQCNHVYYADRAEALEFANIGEGQSREPPTQSQDCMFGTLSEYLLKSLPCDDPERKCSAAAIKGASLDRGISYLYIRDNLISEAIEDTGVWNPTMREWLHCPGSRFAGKDAKAPHGQDIKCPRDGQIGCALVDAMDPQFTGRMTHYLSWTYDSRVLPFVSAIVAWFESVGRENFHEDEVFIYCCMFCNNQYRIIREPTNAEMRGYLLEAFNKRLLLIRDEFRASMIVLLETWKYPMYIKRIWCLWEIFMAKDLGVKMEFALVAEETRHFRDAIHDAYAQIPLAIKSIDVAKAEAYDPADREAILKEIGNGIGCAEVNDVIKTFLIGWFTNEFRSLLEGKGSPAKVESVASIGGDRGAEGEHPSCQVKGTGSPASSIEMRPTGSNGSQGELPSAPANEILLSRVSHR